jgi:ABC-type phosphate transport system substrate-binding protein
MAGCTSASTPIPTTAPVPVAKPTTAPVAPTTAATQQAASGQMLTLNGAGSTFDNPLFSKAFAEYTKAHGNVQVTISRLVPARGFSS